MPRRLFDPPQNLVERYASEGQVVADLGCGPGYYTIAVAESGESAINEMRRILKPKGRAYISVARGPWSYVDLPAWEKILESFKVERRHDGSIGFGERWAIVSTRRV
jgi:ubiquinone/menaquinone biosynthesis C-methylase UbiE